MMDEKFPIILSHFQIAPILKARREGKTEADSSPDFGLSTIQVTLSPEFLEFPDSQRLTWDAVEKIARSENSCFVLENNSPKKIQTFSQLTNRPLSLFPTRSAPTLLVAGFPMHRIKNSDPYRDTLAKVNTLAPIVGRVLDTATGLGYTAIEAAKTAEQVVTIEFDPAAQEIARLNPWSRALFDHPKIRRIIGDSFEIVPTFPSDHFDRILHDPPTFSLAGDLYSEALYRELYRVLRRGGKLFHYVGDPDSKLGGNIMRGVMSRLKQAGFTRIEREPQAFGVTANK